LKTRGVSPERLAENESRWRKELDMAIANGKAMPELSKEVRCRAARAEQERDELALALEATNIEMRKWVERAWRLEKERDALEVQHVQLGFLKVYMAEEKRGDPE